MTIRVSIRHDDLDNAGSLQVTEVDPTTGKPVKRGIKQTIPAAGDWAQFVIGEENALSVVEVAAPEKQEIGKGDVGDAASVLG